MADIKWYHHDNGMITVSTHSGKMLAWDTNDLSVHTLFDTSDSISCHCLSPHPAHSKLAAVGSRSGLLMYDFISGRRVSKLAPSRCITATLWNKQRSDLVFTGSEDGMLSQWDLRNPKIPIFDIQFGLSNPKIKQIFQRFGHGSHPYWISIVSCKGAYALKGRSPGWEVILSPFSDNVRLDIIEGLDLPVTVADNTISIGNRCIENPLGLLDVLVNQANRSLYVLERDTTKLACYR